MHSVLSSTVWGRSSLSILPGFLPHLASSAQLGRLCPGFQQLLLLSRKKYEPGAACLLPRGRTHDGLALHLEPAEAAEDFNKASGQQLQRTRLASVASSCSRVPLGLGQNQVVAIWILH